MKNNDSFFIILITMALVLGALAFGNVNKISKVQEQTPIVIDDTTPGTDTPTEPPEEQPPEENQPEEYNFEDWTVNYLPNGGTGEIISQRVAPNIAFRIKNSNTFTRDGYNFAGWNTKIDGTGENYSALQDVIVLSQYTQYTSPYGVPGQEPEVETITVEHYCLILFAQWEPIEEIGE